MSAVDMVTAAAAPAPSAGATTAATGAGMWTVDRFVVLSLLEDLHVPHVADPMEWAVTDNGALDARGDADENREAGLLTAGSATDSSEEPLGSAKARIRAIYSLPVLASRLGVRWANAELVPYLMRCLQEDEADLSRNVAMMLPMLVLADGKAHLPPPLVLLEPDTVLPILVALLGASDAITRRIACYYTIPKVVFGVSLLQVAAMGEVTSTVTAPGARGAVNGIVSTSQETELEGEAAVISELTWPATARESDVPRATTDAFDRSLCVANTTTSLQTFAMQQTRHAAGGAPSRGLSETVAVFLRLLSLIDDVPWTHVRTSKICLLSMMIRALVDAQHHASAKDHFFPQPASSTQLRRTLAWVAARHMHACFYAYGEHPLHGIELLSKALSATCPDILNLGRTVDGRPASEVRLDNDGVATLDVHVIADIIRALPHLIDVTGSGSLPCLLEVGVAVHSLEQCLLQRYLRCDAPRLKEEVQSYARRHDDSLAGSSFLLFHAVTDALEGVLLRAVVVANLSLDDVQRLLGVARLYFSRGTNYSQWKNRYYSIRRAGHLLEALVQLVGKAAISAASVGDLASVRQLIDDTIRVFQEDLLGHWYPQLCGDCEVEVRTAVAHHSCDALWSAAWLLCNSGVSLTAAQISDQMFMLAQGVVATTQVCVMDVNDRVRASAASSIARALVLQATGRPGISNAQWVPIANSLNCKRVSEALIAILMDLFRDDSHLVLLSVMESFGDVCVQAVASSNAQADVNATADVAPNGSGVLSLMEEELVKLCRSLQSSPTWRVRESYAHLLAQLVGSLLRQLKRHQGIKEGRFKLQQLLHETLLPMLVDVLFDSVKAVRDSAIDAVVLQLNAHPRRCSASPDAAVGNACAPGEGDACNDACRVFVNDILWPSVRDSQRGNATYLLRSSLVIIAVKLGVDLEQHLLPLMDRLSHDAVSNVRLVVAKAVEQYLLRPFVSVDAPLSPGSSCQPSSYVVNESHKQQHILPLLRGLVEDSCRDVRECASRALEACV